MGTFQTWPTKGLEGPIPPFNNQIESIESGNSGYTFNLRVPGAPVAVHTDKNFLVTEIVSSGGKLHEHPKYTATPDGLVFTGNEGIDESQQAGTVVVKYQFETSAIDELRVPSTVHLQVNQNIDVRFSLSGCRAKKNQVVHVSPPS
jgi:hypothetical protein